ncbi:uncharacterized protein K452DRAFT_320125 [Aplosporella prunicola CBS 121167]|uniref:Uncharacterized protein n=1 Tax=Aplosporella prunicola CBS 121167 TaxID=1176127 RepID=A0A6A6B7G0_9PEZI|nr:uncharacterized protein K452DRAFT_320125 [Aplosporella prunicola CBS 121167]KAF2140059.1 hypothetical protein K452DRAFT_320125 [Aplosporella prunicola CBS 121167]
MCITSQLSFALCGCIYPLPPRHCFHAGGGRYCERVVMEPVLVVRDGLCPGCEEEWVRGLEGGVGTGTEKGRGEGKGKGEGKSGSAGVGTRAVALEAGAVVAERFNSGGMGVEEQEREVSSEPTAGAEALDLKEEVKEALKSQLRRICKEASGDSSAPAEEVTLRRRGEARASGSGGGGGLLDARARAFVPGGLRLQRRARAAPHSLSALVEESQEDSALPPSELDLDRAVIRRPTAHMKHRTGTGDAVEAGGEI